LYIYSKYYEHVPVIINEICGKSAPKLTQELEEQIKSMFDQIQSSFDKHSEIVNSKRKNFLNYNYIIYKFCELLGKREYLYLFPLLKSREKLYEHDQIWKGICGDLGWTFIPSI
jgi:predicted AAA+ superfamily ATPase